MNFIMKMKNVLLFFVLMSVFSSYCKAVDQFTKKFCDKSLSNATISELEQCEKILAKEIHEAEDECLKDIKMGTTFQDLRETHCNLKLSRQFMKCLKKRKDFKALVKEFNKTHDKYFACTDKVLGIKNG